MVLYVSEAAVIQEAELLSTWKSLVGLPHMLNTCGL